METVLKLIEKQHMFDNMRSRWELILRCLNLEEGGSTHLSAERTMRDRVELPDFSFIEIHLRSMVSPNAASAVA